MEVCFEEVPMIAVDNTVIARFDAKWVTEPGTCCHIWTAARDPRGYGRFRINGRKGDTYFSHRLAWEWAHKQSADGLVVRHRCDNPPCVNPDHLEIGAHADNVRDRMDRGRSVYVRGDDNGKSKLTEKEVREIKKLLETDMMTIDIAERYGRHPCTICDIKKGRTWRHVV